MHIEQTILSNGLVVITHASPYLESATVGAFVNAGSRQELASNNGVAHFLEHLMFKGTSNRNAFDIATQIEVLGSDINAFTSMDMTAYHVTGLATHVDQAIAILGDVLTDSLFASADIAIESGVIIQEINRSADSPNNVMFDAVQAASYPAQALGRTVLGSADFVTSATTQDFRAFTNQYYTADNMAIVGAGGIKHDAFVRMVETAFAPLTPSADRPEVSAARYVGGTTIDRSRDFKQVTTGIAFESVPIIDDTMFHHALLAEAFGGAMSSPLYTEIREKRGLVYSTGCFSVMNKDNGRIMISGGMTADNVIEFITVACNEFRKMGRAINEIDLLRAKNSYLVSLAMLEEKPFSTACFMARSHWQRGYVQDLAEMRERIAAVTLDDLKTAARQVLTSMPSIVLIGPGPQADYDELVRAAIN